jgi:hypothetical protein
LPNLFKRIVAVVKAAGTTLIVVGSPNINAAKSEIGNI